ncbi:MULTISPECIES: envelope stress response activation lipoprotein NlpE [unclassified Brenneria]|uniref:envelope stress response activation lipoprotein NlpE n=1 Tax=unclassified Brenneria TaxID=2634434 RepID=UPI0029C554CF|nr:MULTISPECIES: envelope stress response activation lipoprotein NlpE [unclassified Brenneria]MDX5628021.1 envelope stress response activation lipoprotein NlpE [Brenneria sp. L3-3Z]MDX5694959.1 envelope stress response activation lipoprotein NlpE [Brenneria sp. L4-2C]MEE3660747.1 envelope stress response activation lipoprotein NlpE [Brenneria sp. g21c3]
MKKLAIGALLVAVISVLIGCHTRSLMQEEPLKPMAQSYRGILPCADCEGIETSLFLSKDGTFILREHYQTTREGTTTFAEYGQWRRTADKLVLTDSRGDKRYFRPQGNDLEMLDQEGIPIDSPHSYRLNATDLALPDTPMPMKGMYRYMADAAVFADCATGKTFAVAHDATLERQYMTVSTEAGAPVFMEFSAHFAVLPAMEKGKLTTALVPDGGKARMNTRQHCDPISE